MTSLASLGVQETIMALNKNVSTWDTVRGADQHCGTPTEIASHGSAEMLDSSRRSPSLTVSLTRLRRSGHDRIRMGCIADLISPCVVGYQPALGTGLERGPIFIDPIFIATAGKKRIIKMHGARLS